MQVGRTAILRTMFAQRQVAGPASGYTPLGMDQVNRRPEQRRTVLFLCRHNAARSQMAEALLRARFPDRYEAASAGTAPSSIHPLTLLVLEEIGVPHIRAAIQARPGVLRPPFRRRCHRLRARRAIVSLLPRRAPAPPVVRGSKHRIRFGRATPLRVPTCSRRDRCVDPRGIRDTPLTEPSGVLGWGRTPRLTGVLTPPYNRPCTAGP